jgi:hypothetical protein
MDINKKKVILLETEILPVSNHFPASLLNNLSKQERKKLLKQMFIKNINMDAFESGVLNIKNGKFSAIVGNNMSSIAGYLFEAFVVRHANENKEFRKELYMWSQNSKRKLSDKEIEKIKTFGFGFPKIKNNYPQIYAPQHYNHDIGFLRKSMLHQNLLNGTILFNDNQLSNDTHMIVKQNGQALGVQIKAITGNEKEEVVLPIINKKYSHVLTLLRNKETNKQSVDICKNIIYKMHEKKEIDIETMVSALNAIRSPEQLGIKQQEVDDYFETIQYWFEDGMKYEIILNNPLEQQAVNALLSN